MSTDLVRDRLAVSRDDAPPNALPVLPSGRLVATLRYHRRPLATLHDARTRHGDLFPLRMLAMGPVVVACTPRLLVPLPLLHRDPAVLPDPCGFDPARFQTPRVRPLAPRPERMVVRGTVLVPVRKALAVLRRR